MVQERPLSSPGNKDQSGAHEAIKRSKIANSASCSSHLCHRKMQDSLRSLSRGQDAAAGAETAASSAGDKQEAGEVRGGSGDLHLLLPVPRVRLRDCAEDRAGESSSAAARDHHELHPRLGQEEEAAYHGRDQRQHAAQGILVFYNFYYKIMA